MAIEIIGTEIDQLEQAPFIVGTEKLPTGGRGLYHVTIDQVRDYVLTYFGKEAILLGQVDNTSDEDKPLSKATRDALDKKISFLDPYVRSINGLTGDIDLVAETIGLGRVNNTSDKEKPLSDASINALNLKLDKTSFKAFKRIFEEFQNEIAVKFGALDTLDQDILQQIVNLELADQNIIDDLNELSTYVSNKINTLSSGFSEQQYSALTDFLTSSFNSYLTNSIVFNQKIQEIKDEFDLKIATINQTLASLGIEDERLNTAINSLTIQVNNKFTQIDADILELENSVANGGVDLDAKAQELIDLINQQINSLKPSIVEAGEKYKDSLFDFQQTVSLQNGILTQKIIEINGDISNQKTINQTLDDFIHSQYDAIVDMLVAGDTTLQGLIDAASEAAKKDINDLAYEMQDITTIVDTRYNLITGIVETQVENNKIQMNQLLDEVNTRIDEANTLIDSVQADVDAKATYYNSEFLRIEGVITNKTDQLISDLNQEVIDRNAAIDSKVNTALADINTKLDELNLEEINTLSQKIDDLNARIDAGAGTITQEMIDYVTNQINSNNTTVMNSVNDLIGDITLEQVDRLGKIDELQNGITNEATARISGDDQLLQNITNYKTSNDTALANVREEITTKIEDGIANSSTMTALDARVETLETDSGTMQTNLASVIDKANATATQSSATANTVEALSATVTTNNTQVRGLIAEERDIRTSALGTVTTQLNTLNASFTNLNTAGKNLLKKSNVALVRPAGSYLIGSYTIGEAIVVNQKYTLLACITHDVSSEPSAPAEIRGWQGSSVAIPFDVTTKGSVRKVFKTTFTPTANNFSTINFYYYPQATTSGTATVHWAMLVRGDAVPTTDWVESPFDVLDREVVSNANIATLQTAIADETQARIQQIDQARTDFVTLDTATRAIIQTEKEALSNEIESNAQLLETLSTNFETEKGVTSSLVSSEATARSNADIAISQSVSLLQSSFSGTGVNLLAAEYSDPVGLKSVTINAVTPTIEPSTLRDPAVAKQWKIKKTGTGANSYLAFAKTLTTYDNLRLKPNNSYIVSAYVKAGIAGTKFKFAFRASSGLYINGPEIVLTTTQVRYSSVLTVPNTVPAEGGYLLIYCDTGNQAVSDNNYILVDMIMVEKQVGTGTTPSDWVSSSGNLEASIIEINKAITTSETSYASQFQALTTKVNDNDTAVKGLIVDERTARTTAIDTVVSQVNSLQASFGSNIVGTDNLWWFTNSGSSDYGTATKEMMTSDLQHQKLTITAQSTGIFSNLWQSLRSTEFPSKINLEQPHSVSFEIKSAYSKIRVFAYVYGQANPTANLLQTVEVNKWVTVRLNNLINNNTGTPSDSYGGLIGIRYVAADNNVAATDLVGKTLEIRNIQLQQGTTTSAYTKPSWTTTKAINQVSAAVTNEATARANADEAFGSQLSAITTSIDTNDVAVRGLIATEVTNRTTAVGNVVTQMNTLQSTFDNFTIGSANLAAYTDKFRVGTVGNSRLLREITPEGYLKLTIQDPATTLGYTYITTWWSADTDLKVTTDNFRNTTGISIVFSFWAKAVDTTKVPVGKPRLFLASNYNYVDFDKVIGNLASGGWCQYYKVINLTAPLTTDIIPNIQFHTDSLNGGLIISRWKIELGNKPTDWSDYKEMPKVLNSKIDATVVNLTKAITDGDTASANQISGLTTQFTTVPNAGINLLSSKVTNPLDVSNFYPSGSTDTIALYDSTIVTGLKGIRYDPNQAANVVLAISPNTFVAEFTDLNPGKYIFSFYSYSSITNQSISVNLMRDASNIVNALDTTAITLSTTLTRYSKVFDITTAGKYTARFVVSAAGSTVSRPMFIERMMLEQQYGTNPNPSKWSEGQAISPYSLLPVSFSQARLGTQLDATSTVASSAASRVNTLETTVADLDTEVSGAIINLQDSVTNLAGTTSTDINTLKAGFKRDNLMSSPNLWVFKDALGVGSPALFTPIPEEYAYSFKSSSNTSGIISTLTNTVLPINTKFVISFKVKVESGTLNDVSIGVNNGIVVEEMYVDNIKDGLAGFPYAANKIADFAFICSTSSVVGPYNITIKANGNNFTSIVKISNVQIELGLKRSVWTPAYQDTKQDYINSQSQINDAKTVAANATKAVADRLESYRTELKGDVAASNVSIGNLTSAVSDFTSATGTQFNTINTKFTTMPNAGVNLLPMSIAAPLSIPNPAFTAGYPYVVEASTDLTTVNRWKITPTTSASSGIYFNEAGPNTNRTMYLGVGKYIFSFYAKANTDGFKVDWLLYGPSSIGRVQHTLTTSIARYSQVFDVVTAGYYCLLSMTNPAGAAGGIVYFERMMLEVKVADNNAPSNWVSDTSINKQFTNTDAKINQVSQTASDANSATLQIATDARTLATNNQVIALGKIQDLTDVVTNLDSSTATKFTNINTQFSNLVSSGKNRLKSSNVPLVRSGTAYNIGLYSIGGGNLVVGEKYTLVFCGSHLRGGADTTSYLGAWVSSSQGLSVLPANQIVNATKAIKMITFTRTSAGVGDTIQFYTYPSGTDAATTSTVHWAVLFEGELNVKPTDWSQSPYDIDSMFAANVTATDAKIAQAQQTSTDANSATAQSLSQLTTSFNSMILGGDNLYDDPGKFFSVGSAETGLTSSLNSDKTVLTVVSTNAAANYVSGTMDMTKLPRLFELCTTGNKVCVSFDIRITSGGTVNSPTVYWGAQMGYLATVPLPGETLEVGKWRRVYHVRDFAAGYTTPSIHFGFAGLVGTYEIRNVKIEKGSRPTPFDSSFLNSVKAIDSKVESYQSANTTAFDTQANTLNTVKSSFENMVIGGQNVWSIENATPTQEYGTTTITWIDKDQEYFKGTMLTMVSNVCRVYFGNCLVTDQKVSIGDTFTVSFWIRASSAKALTWYAYTYGGQIANRPINVTTNWQYVTGTLTVSNVSSNTGPSQLFSISVPSGAFVANDWYEVKQVQLQLGTRATSFVKSSPLILKNLTKTTADLTTFQSTYASDKVATAQSFASVRTEFGNADTALDGRINTLSISTANADTAINQRITTVESSVYPQLTLPNEYDDKEANKWLKVVYTKRGGEAETVIPEYKHLLANTIITSNYVGSSTSLVSSTHDNVFIAYRTFVNVISGKTINLGAMTNNCAVSMFVDGVKVYESVPRSSGGVAVTFPLVTGWHCIDLLVNEGVGDETVSVATSLGSQVNFMYPAMNTKGLVDNLGPRVDALVLNNYYTKTGTNEAIAAVDTKLSSKLAVVRDSDSLTADYNLTTASEWQSHYSYDLTSYFTTVTDGKIGPNVFSKPTTVANCWNYSRTVLPNNRAYKISVWMRREVGSGGSCGINWLLIKADGVRTTAQYSSASKVVTADGNWQLVEHILDLTSQKDLYPQFSPGFFINHTVSGYKGEVQGYHVRALLASGDIDNTIATVAQVQTKLDATVIDSYYTKVQADQATSGKISDFKSTLQVGSANLLPNSSFETNTTGWLSNGTPTLTIVSDATIPTTATKCLKVVTTAVLQGIVRPLPYNIPVGTEITFSVWLRADTAGVKVRLLPGDHDITTYEATLSTTWTRYFFTTKVVSTGIPQARIYGSAASTFYVSRAQYEVGNIPSDWSKAAIDIDSQLDSTANAIENINTAVGMNGSQATKITNLESTTTTLTKDVSDAGYLAKSFNSGKLLFGDPTFKTGTNSLGTYSGTAPVRQAKSSDNPTTSGFEIKLTSTAVSSPGWAGFYQMFSSRANAVFLIKYIMKFPTGWTVRNAGNQLGTGAKDFFIGNNEGTGTFQTYLRRVECGYAGTFSTGGHVYFNKTTTATPDATASSPLEIYIASVETYDLTDYDDVPPAVKTTLADYQSQMDTLTTKDDAQAFRYEQLRAAFTVDGYNGRLPVNPDFAQVNKWLMIVYTRPGALSTTPPGYDKVNTYAIESVTYVVNSTANGNGTYAVPAQKLAVFRTRVYVATGKTVNVGPMQGDDVWGLYVNGVLVNSGLNSTAQTTDTTFALTAGWNTVDVIADNGNSTGGFKFTTQLNTLVDKMYAPDRNEVLVGSFGTVMNNYYTKADADGAIAAGAQTISSSNVQQALQIQDTRNDNQPPSWYQTNYPRRKVQEFKFGSSIGSPGGTTVYGVLETTIPWSDSSGGSIIQSFSVGDSLNTYTRYSINPTTWSAWKSDLKNLDAAKPTMAQIDAAYKTQAGVDGAIAQEIKTLSASIGSDNIVTNGNFSNLTGGLYGWRNNSGTSISAYKDANSKTWCLINSTDTTTAFKGLIQTITSAGNELLLSNTKYTLSFLAQGLDANNKTVQLIVHRINSANTNTQTSANFTINNTSPVRCTFTFTTIADLKHINIIIYSPTGYAPNLIVTDVMLQQGEVATAFVKSATELQAQTQVVNEAVSGPDGILAKYAVKVNAGGLVAGYGLIADANNGTPTSAFAVEANQFYIGSPTSNKKPFIVLTTPGTINGIPVPAGTYIDSVLIANATIKSAQINSLTTDKIVVEGGTSKAGNLTAGRTYTINSNGSTSTTSVPNDGNYKVGSTYVTFGTGSGTGVNGERDYLEVDLGAVYAVTQSIVYWYAQDARYYWYKIKYSVDGVTWNYFTGNATTSGWSTSNPATGDGAGTKYQTVSTEDAFYPGVTARYFRLYGNGNNINAANHIYEWLLYGTTTTVIDGSQIIANSITSSQIRADAITVGSNTTFQNGYNPAEISSTLSGQILSINKSVGSNMLPNQFDYSKSNAWAVFVAGKTQPYLAANIVPDYSYINLFPTTSSYYANDGSTMVTTNSNSVIYHRAIFTVNTTKTINLGNFVGDDAHAIYLDGNLIFSATAYVSAGTPVSFNVNAGTHVIDVIVNNATGNGGFTTPTTLSSQVDSMYAAKIPTNNIERLDNGTGKVFTKLASNRLNGGSSSTLVIHTPIKIGAFMCDLTITGYNYSANSDGQFQIDVSFYAYTSGDPFPGNKRAAAKGLNLTNVSFALDANGCVVIILERSGTWSYPTVYVDRASITHTMPPDSYQGGWSIAWETDFSVYTNRTYIVNIDLLETQAGSQQKVDSLEIGGRNYLLNSSLEVNRTNWADNGGAVVSIVADTTIPNGASACFKVVTTGSGQGIYQSLNNLLKDTNIPVTVSFWAKASASTGLTVSSEGHTGTTSVTVGTTWKKYSVNLTKTVANPNIVFYLQAASTMYLSRLQYERGNKATEWSPALEDIDAEITAAQTSANSANALLADIASDAKLTPLEKQLLKTEWDSIVNEKNNYEAQATAYNVSAANYTSAFNTLNGNIPSLLSNMSATSNIVRATFQSWFSNYYTQRSSLLKAVSDSAKGLTDSKSKTFTTTPTVPYAVGDLWRNGTTVLVATVARSTGGTYTVSDWIKVGDVTSENTAADVINVNGVAAATVSANAQAGKTLSDNIMSDLVITPVEKSGLLNEWNRIKAEYTNLSAQATALSISFGSYTTAYNALNGVVPRIELDVLVSMVTNYTMTTTNRDAFKAKLKAYYDQATATAKLITDTVNSTANNAQNIANSKSRTFTSQPTIPYSVGDLWRNGTTVSVAIGGRVSGVFTAADWIKVGDVTSENTANDVSKVNGVAAATVANNAQIGATLSSNIMSDLVITPVEKSALLNEWNRIKAEYSNLAAQATALGVSKTSFDTAYTALNGTAPRIEADVLASMTTNYTLTTTTRDSFKAQLNTYFVNATAIAKAITDKVNSTADSAQTTANSKAKMFTATPTVPYSVGDIWRNGNSIFVTTITRATGSYTASDWIKVSDLTSENVASDTSNVNGVPSATVASQAAAGKTMADQIISDLIITPVEKSALYNEWNRIQAEYSSLIAQATALSVITSTYSTAYNNLNGVAPRIQTDVLASMTSNYTLTTATRDSFKSKINTYYTQATALSTAINNAVKAAAKDYTDSQQTEMTTTVDLTALDANTYYPVTFALSQSVGTYDFSVYVPLSKYTASWASHSSGTFSLSLSWSSNASGWGAQVVTRLVTVFSFAWITGNQSPIQNINQLSNSSVEFVFLRGGTKYDITHHKSTTPVVRTAAYTISSQTVTPTTYNAALLPTTFSASIIKAQADADAANNVLTDISSDSKLTPVEKQVTKSLWDEIIKEGLNVESQARTYGVPYDTYTAAYNTLYNYLTPLLGTAALMATTSTIDRSVFQTNFANYYSKRSDVLKLVSENISKVAEANARKYTDDTTGNLVNNVTRSGTTERWSAGTVTNQAFLGYTVPVHTLNNSGDVMALSDKFVVDPSKAYEVSMWMKSDNASTGGSDYFGLHCYNAAGTNIGGHAIPNSTGADTSSANSNMYFWNGTHSNHTDWVKRTAYIMPAGTSSSLMKNIGSNVTTNVRMLPTTTHIALRWLNYYNGSTVNTTWVVNAKVVEVDPTVVMNLANANALVDDIAADGKLTPVEKKQLKIIWDNILKEKVTISATADSYAIATATKDAYNTAYTTLFNQVNPLLANLTTTSDVVRATMNTNFANYYDKRTIINQAIDTAWVSNGGTINGGKIATDTVTSDQILLSSGNMIYGGLDNFSNYSSMPSGYGDLATNTLSQDFPLFGPNSVKHVSTGANSYYYLHPSTNTPNGWLKLEAGQQYILSSYVRTTSSVATSVNLAAVVREGATGTSGVGTGTGNLVITAADGWKQVYIKITAGGTNPFLSYYIRNVNTGITTYWTGFMLEKVTAGQTKPYQYTQGNVTRIDGGNIVTNSIHASKIQVDTLVVDTANIKDLSVDTLKIKNGAVTSYYYAVVPEIVVPALTPGRSSRSLNTVVFNGSSYGVTTPDGESWIRSVLVGSASDSAFSNISGTGAYAVANIGLVVADTTNSTEGWTETLPVRVIVKKFLESQNDLYLWINSKDIGRSMVQSLVHYSANGTTTYTRYRWWSDKTSGYFLIGNNYNDYIITNTILFKA